LNRLICPQCKAPADLSHLRNVRILDEILVLLKASSTVDLEAEKRPAASSPGRRRGGAGGAGALAAGAGAAGALASIKAELEVEDRRTPMPKKVYHLLKPAAIKDLCVAVGLPVTGTKDQLIRRHKEFVERYNAQCDSARPMSRQEIADAVMRDEAGSRKRATVSDAERAAEAPVSSLSSLQGSSSFEALKRDIANRKKQKLEQPPAPALAPALALALAPAPAPPPLKREVSHISLSDSDQPVVTSAGARKGSSAHSTPRPSNLNPPALKDDLAILEILESSSQLAPDEEGPPSSQRSQRSQRTRRSNRSNK
jgi:hypothetical protein